MAKTVSIKTCPKCGGSGRIVDHDLITNHRRYEEETDPFDINTCLLCNGEGRMALTGQEVDLALKGHPVKTSAGRKVFDVVEVDCGTLAFKLERSKNIFIENINHPCHDLHLDYDEAGRTGFIPLPEFGDVIEVCGGEINTWESTHFVQWDKDGYCMAVDPERSVEGFEGGESDYYVMHFDYWRWPRDSVFNIKRYCVYCNGQEVSLSEEQIQQIRETVESWKKE